MTEKVTSHDPNPTHVEVIARALADYDWVNSLVDPRKDQSDEARQRYADAEWYHHEPDAVCALQALAAAGYKILPREPSEAMPARRVAQVMVDAWSKVGGDVFGDLDDLSRIKVEGTVDFLAIARIAIEEISHGQ